MNLIFSGFGLNREFIPDHNLKIKQTERWASNPKENFLNFYVYCDDTKEEILSVGCNKGGLTSFIQSQICVLRQDLDSYHKNFLSSALNLGLKRLPAAYLENMNDLNLNMNFASWDGVIDPEHGDIVIVGACYDKSYTEKAFWTHIFISPTMLDYNKATLPVEERFSLADMQNLYTIVNKS